MGDQKEIESALRKFEEFLSESQRSKKDNDLIARAKDGLVKNKLGKGHFNIIY